MVIAAAIVAPESTEVLPLVPEFVRQSERGRSQTDRRPAKRRGVPGAARPERLGLLQGIGGNLVGERAQGGHGSPGSAKPTRAGTRSSSRLPAAGMTSTSAVRVAAAYAACTMNLDY